MALLGKRLLVMLSILTVSMPAATYFLWFRVKGLRLARMGARVLLIVGWPLCCCSGPR
jgi:hypothetical protein